jgi:hypothetical protein
MLGRRILNPGKESDQLALPVRIGLFEDALDLVAHRDFGNAKLFCCRLWAEPVPMIDAIRTSAGVSPKALTSVPRSGRDAAPRASA